MTLAEQTTLFSQEEFDRRVERVEELMAEEGLAALIVYDDDRMTGAGSVRYLSNFFNTGLLSPSAVVLVAGREPTLCIAPGFQKCQFAWAERLSWIRKVRGTPSGMWRVDWPTDIAEALGEAGFTGGKVGIDGMEFMSHRLVESLAQKLGGSSFTGVSGLVGRVRQNKSFAEAEVLRRTASLSRLGITAFIEAVKPEVRQAEAIAAAEFAAKKAGADEGMMYMGTGLPWIWGYHRGDLRFGNGHMVAAEFNARYLGYHGQVCRTLILGEPTSRQQTIQNTVVAAYERMLASTEPGMTAEQLFDVGMAVIRQAGFEYSGVRFGHGLGLSLAEGFSIAPGDKTVIHHAACLALHPNIVVSVTGDAAIYGEPILVTQSGVEVLGL
jgi:Xaa-Pro aminopeptidase